MELDSGLVSCFIERSDQVVCCLFLTTICQACLWKLFIKRRKASVIIQTGHMFCNVGTLNFMGLSFEAIPG